MLHCTLLFCTFIQPDSHIGQCWSSQYSQCWPCDHAADPDCCRPSNARHQPPCCCGLAAVSLLHSCYDLLHFSEFFWMTPILLIAPFPSDQGSIQDLCECGGRLLRRRHRVPHVQGRARRAGRARGQIWRHRNDDKEPVLLRRHEEPPRKQFKPVRLNRFHFRKCNCYRYHHR